MPQDQLHFLRDDAIVREDTFCAAYSTAALEAVLLRLDASRPGETVILLQDDIETGHAGPRGGT